MRPEALLLRSTEPLHMMHLRTENSELASGSFHDVIMSVKSFAEYEFTIRAVKASRPFRQMCRPVGRIHASSY
jgi:hypothetical protein